MNEELNEVKSLTEDMINNTWLWMPNWKWMALGAALISAVALYKIVSWIFTGTKGRLQKRMDKHSVSAYLINHDIQRPLALFIACLFMSLVVKALSLPGDGAHVVSILLKLVLAFAVITFAYMAADAAGERFKLLASKTENTLDDQLAPLLTRTLKFLVVVFGVLVTLQNVGVNVVSVLAGLGLGGLAVALAAQDTFANIFGSITLIFDRPFQIGDLVKVGDVEGTVEEIGLRSTRIRLGTKSLVSIPNSVMAKANIENLGARQARRIRHIIGVTYNTTPHQLLEFVDHVRYLIFQHPKTQKEGIIVNFVGFGDSSLNIMVNFYVEVPTFDEEQGVQQEILIQIMQVAEHDKIEFAFPTRTLLIENTENTPVKPQPNVGGAATL